MFIDHVIIEAIAGDGGDGCVAFRREKFVPRGGPNGGNGGRGGDVVVEASSQVSTLIDLHYQRHYKSGRGEHGMGKSMRGKDGEDTIIQVPVGTIIKDSESGAVVGEVIDAGDRVIVAKGGRHGFGNEHFKTSRNRTPRQFTYGGDGEKRRLEITLKLVADVGLIGEPNAGKSTLISAVSAAHPKIAGYPFTTITPVLGIVRAGEFDSFVMVDIPGLIEGAHEGRGMGKAFLRHIERCRVLVFMVDAGHPDPLGSYQMLRGELLRHDPALLEQPSVLAITKCDTLPGNAADVPEALLRAHDRTHVISAVSREGIEPFLYELMKLLREA